MEGIYIESDLNNTNSGNDWQRMSFYKEHFNFSEKVFVSTLPRFQSFFCFLFGLVEAICFRFGEGICLS